MSRFPNNGGRGGRGRTNNSRGGGRGSNNRSQSYNTNNRNNQRNAVENRLRNRVNNTHSIPSTTAPAAKNLKCDPIHDASNPAYWLIWLNKQCNPLISHLGLNEYFTKGTINGKTKDQLKVTPVTYPQVTATVCNVNNFEKRKGSQKDAFIDRLTAITTTFPWFIELTMLPTMDAAGNPVYRQIHPNNCTGANGMDNSNIRRAKLQFPGLSTPDNWATMTAEEKSNNQKDYLVDWHHVPRTYVQCRDRRFTGATTDAGCPKLLDSWEIKDQIDYLADIYYRKSLITAEQIEAEYAAKQLANPTLTLTLEEHCKLNRDASEIEKIESGYQYRLNATLKITEIISGIMQKASVVTGKFQGPVRDICATLLDNQLHYEAFQAVKTHFAEMSISTIADVEVVLRAIRISQGEMLASNYRNLFEAFVQWNSTKAMKHHAAASVGNNLKNFHLDMDKIHDSSGEMSDGDYLIKHGSEPITSMSTRAEILLESIAHSRVLSTAISQIRTWNDNERTVPKILQICSRVESDKIGQEQLSKEQNSKGRLGDKRGWDEFNHSSNVTDGHDPDAPCYHPGHGGHSNKQCRKQQFEDKTDANETSRKRQNNSNYTSSNGGKVRKPCQYCLNGDADDIESADYHENTSCWSDPKSSEYKPNWKRKTNAKSRGNNAVNAAIAASLQQMTMANNNSQKELVTALVTTLKEALNSTSSSNKDD